MAEESYNIDLRAAELSKFTPQQLLGYIAALLEVVTENQVKTVERISELSSDTFSVEGTVEVDNWRR
jgi:hypothetical protein